ncbi:hypothetical protein JXR93_09560 [bacterium]|nr:hypothetical protein [bacterium]
MGKNKKNIRDFQKIAQNNTPKKEKIETKNSSDSYKNITESENSSQKKEISENKEKTVLKTREIKNVGKIFYRFDMKLKTALYIGKGMSDPAGVEEFYKNGAGEFVIPGTSIAGVFLSRASDLGIYKKSENQSNKNDIFASRVVFRSTVLNNAVLKIRDRVRIDSSKKVAQDGSKFSYWEIEPDNETDNNGFSFNFIVEIDGLSFMEDKQTKKSENFDKMMEKEACGDDLDELQSEKEKNKAFSKRDILTIQEADEIIQKVASSFMKDGVAFGGHTSSGNGWCELKNIYRVDLNQNNFKEYLNCKDISDFVYNKSASVLDEIKKIDVKSVYDLYTLKVAIGSGDDDYGVNSLLIGGGNSHVSLNTSGSDICFVNTGKRVYIPGSSIKGVFSAFMEKYGVKNWDSFLGHDKEDGSPYDEGGWFLVEDLFPKIHTNIVNGNLKVIERHAEDEFTRAIFEGSKFNEEALFNTTFEGIIRVTKRKVDKERNEIDSLIEALKEGMKYSLISLGSGGMFPKFSIEKRG